MSRRPLLEPHQLEAIEKMHLGCILHGGVGVGKSRTALGFYYTFCGGNLEKLVYQRKRENLFSCRLYIITTAHKRDLHEWELEAAHFGFSQEEITVDSWNNIKKYKDAIDGFFIFDEQRLVGNGVWVQTFLNIAKYNAWILLTATPGDSWEDYIPVFVANGFYKNRSDFMHQHVIQRWNGKYPQVIGYLNVSRLVRSRDAILVEMPFERHTTRQNEIIECNYDRLLYHSIGRTRWNPWEDRPIETASELCMAWRRVCNQDESRQVALLELLEKHPAVIIFYYFDYELDILRSLAYPEGTEIAEWNGHLHQPVPKGEKWIYLVQYTAGCEGWNCVTTDTIIFYSQQYSYKTLEQAEGRIDRMTTPFANLYYYHFKSAAPIDIAIHNALKQKKEFNEGRYVNRLRM